MTPPESANDKALMPPPPHSKTWIKSPSRRAAPCAWHENVQFPGVSHTICPRCLAREMALIDALAPPVEGQR